MNGIPHKPRAGRIDEQALELALCKADVFGLAESDGVRLGPMRGKERGGARCPRAPGACTSKSDAFRVSAAGDRQRWFCRQCTPRGGDAIDYLRAVRGLTFPDAVRELERITGVCIYAADTARHHSRDLTRAPSPAAPRALVDDELGVELPDELPEPPAQAWQERARAFLWQCESNLWGAAGGKPLAYLKHERMLTDETILRYQIGVNPRPVELAPGVFARAGYTLPHYYAGDLWRVRIRRFESETNPREREHKYKLLSGAGERKGQLYNADELERHPGAPAVLCGGEFDALVLQQAAPEGVVCLTFGSETNRPTWEAAYLLRERPVFIAFDSDAAGASGAAAWLSAIPRAHVIKPPGAAHDITDAARAGLDLRAWLAAEGVTHASAIPSGIR